MIKKVKKCLTCGKEFVFIEYPSRKTRGKYCSRKCWRPHNKKGGWIDNQGYHVIGIGHTGKAYLHRLLAEKKMGRKLRTKEVVHHINGDILDNRLSNLAIISHSEHSKIHLPPRDTKTGRFINA